MNKAVLWMLGLIATLVLSIGIYIHTHHECVDGSYGTPAHCQQVQLDIDLIELGDLYSPTLATPEPAEPPARHPLSEQDYERLCREEHDRNPASLALNSMGCGRFGLAAT